ncbi:MAG: hypothetical protein ACEQSK_06920 [Sphingomonadaceae bacterium]
MSYSARRMLSNEFKTDKSVVARCPAGALRHFAVESEAGEKLVGFTWSEAVAQRDALNADEHACLMFMVPA